MRSSHPGLSTRTLHAISHLVDAKNDIRDFAFFNLCPSVIIRGNGFFSHYQFLLDFLFNLFHGLLGFAHFIQNPYSFLPMDGAHRRSLALFDMFTGSMDIVPMASCSFSSSGAATRRAAFCRALG